VAGAWLRWFWLGLVCRLASHRMRALRLVALAHRRATTAAASSRARVGRRRHPLHAPTVDGHGHAAPPANKRPCISNFEDQASQRNPRTPSLKGSCCGLRCRRRVAAVASPPPPHSPRQRLNTCRRGGGGGRARGKPSSREDHAAAARQAEEGVLAPAAGPPTDFFLLLLVVVVVQAAARAGCESPSPLPPLPAIVRSRSR
jgi:hypothetical protein